MGVRRESGATALRRALRRARAGGFTLVELMIVVILVATLALLASPTMRSSRNDRLAFDYARRIQQMIHRARTRAAGRGAAHLVVAGPSGVRGKVLLFEALDNTPAPGPIPVASCKRPPQTVVGGQWTSVVTHVPGTISNTARFIDGVDLDAPGLNVEADIRATFRAYGAVRDAFAMCVTPSGTTYVGFDTDIGGAINNMLIRPPFDEEIEVEVNRNWLGVKAGLGRRVIQASTAAPRIKSQ